MEFEDADKLEYEIDPNLGSSHQVGLFLKCISSQQSEEIAQRIRKNFFVPSKIFPSNRSAYTHFMYVNSTEKDLTEMMPDIQVLFTDNSEKFKVEKLKTIAQAAQEFKAWNKKFDAALKKLESEISNLGGNNRSSPHFFLCL